MLCSTDSADPLAEFSEFNIPLKQSFHILTISEPPFAPPTNVGSDEDLFLLLNFWQNDFLALFDLQLLFFNTSKSDKHGWLTWSGFLKLDCYATPYYH